MNEPITESVLNLPQLDPPEDLWQRIRARIDGKSKGVHWWVPASLAASIVAVALVTLNYMQMQEQKAEMEDLKDLINEVAVLEFNLLNAPRDNHVESPPQVIIGEYLNAIDQHLARPARLNAVHQRELLERKYTLLKNYQLLQVDRDTKPKRNTQIL